MNYLKMNRLFLGLIALLILCFTGNDAAMAKQIANRGQISAHVNEDYTCSKVIPLTIKAPDNSFFTGSIVEVQSVLWAAQQKLRQECSKFKQFDVTGLVKGKKVYQGHALLQHSWVLFNSGSQQGTGKQKITIGEDDNVIVYRDENLTIKGVPASYMHIWCGAGVGKHKKQIFRLSAFYTVDHFERDSLFKPDIETFLQRKVLPQIKSYCGLLPPKIELVMMDNQGYGGWDVFVFSSANGKVVKQSYTPPSDHKTANVDKNKLDEYIARMLPASGNPKPKPTRGKLLFSDDLIKIYARNPLDEKKNMYSTVEVELVYTMDHDERVKRFSSGVCGSTECSQYLGPILSSFVKGDKVGFVPDYQKKRIHVYFYKEGEKEYWDKVVYKFSSSSYAEVDYRIWSPAAKKHIIDVQANIWGGCTGEGPFCKLPAGRYLDAIYKYDIETIKEIDKQSIAPHESLLEYLAHRYMKSYYDNWIPCHTRIDKIGKTFSFKVTDTMTYNEYGEEDGVIPGGTVAKTYYAPMAFKGLLYRLGNAHGKHLPGNSRWISKEINYMFHGVDKLQTQFKCDSPEIKQFEKNLISLTEQYLKYKDSGGEKYGSKPKEPLKNVDSNSKKKTQPVPESAISNSRPPEDQVNRFINTRESFKMNFPDRLALTAPINDFLLARFYPDMLNQGKLEAMMSSRWSYEQNMKEPLGGLFFNPESAKPEHKDIRKLTPKFREWLISRAKILPGEMIMDVSLQYGYGTMSSIDKCVKLIPEKDSPMRISQDELEQAARRLKKCEDRNRNAEQLFKSCENARKELEQAKQRLANAKKGGCGPINENIKNAKSSEGPCKFPSDMTMASMKTEMTKCITTTCGTPSASTDMMAYQKCVQAVSKQFSNEIGRQMGQAPRKQNTVKKNACQAAETEIQEIEQRLARYRCDLISQMPESSDCSSMVPPEQPDFLNIEKIDLSSLVNCSDAASVFNRRSKSSAALLPRTQPYRNEHHSFMLSLDKLALPYDLPIASKGPWTKVNARIKLVIKGADKNLNHRSQLGLAAEVRSIDYNE